MPFSSAIKGPWTLQGGLADSIVAYLDLVFGHYKFLGLFTLLFGFGLATQQARLAASGAASIPFELFQNADDAAVELAEMQRTPSPDGGADSEVPLSSAARRF
ncbi:MAG: hypothetical protein GY704_10220, partial [Phycisphaeraceae bacterium]|nr:hypothetical protein [Phycisphaeraceae bacterium]